MFDKKMCMVLTGLTLTLAVAACDGSDDDTSSAPQQLQQGTQLFSKADRPAYANWGNVAIIGTGFGERSMAPIYQRVGFETQVISPRDTDAIKSAHRPRNAFEPVFQNIASTIATVIRLTVMLTGTSRVTASICLARIRPISRSVISPTSIRAIEENPPIQPGKFRSGPPRITERVNRSTGDFMPGQPSARYRQIGPANASAALTRCRARRQR